MANYRHGLNPTLPSGQTSWDIWQNTAYFWVPGCNEIADGNWFNGPLDAARAWFGNYRQGTPPPQDHRTFFRSHFEGLHIRQNPTNLSKEVGHLTRGEMVELEDVGGKDAWVKHARGWSAVECDEYRYMEVVK